MQRREFIKTTALMAASGALVGFPSSVLASEKELPVPTYDRLPRWRGFNLLEKFDANRQQPFQESDYAWLAELGFNFTRLPLSYRCSIKSGCARNASTPGSICRPKEWVSTWANGARSTARHIRRSWLGCGTNWICGIGLSI